MGAKKGSRISTGEEKRNVVRTTIEMKKEITAKTETGGRESDIATQHYMAK